jgi:hypothetical protein
MEFRLQFAERQFLGAHDAFGAEADVGIEGFPTLGAESFHRQQLACRLHCRHPAFGLAGIGVGADQRPQVGKLQ